MGGLSQKTVLKTYQQEKVRRKLNGEQSWKGGNRKKRHPRDLKAWTNKDMFFKKKLRQLGGGFGPTMVSPYGSAWPNRSGMRKEQRNPNEGQKLAAQRRKSRRARACRIYDVGAWWVSLRRGEKQLLGFMPEKLGGATF